MIANHTICNDRVLHEWEMMTGSLCPTSFCAVIEMEYGIHGVF